MDQTQRQIDVRTEIKRLAHELDPDVDPNRPTNEDVMAWLHDTWPILRGDYDSRAADDSKLKLTIITHTLVYRCAYTVAARPYDSMYADARVESPESMLEAFEPEQRRRFLETLKDLIPKLRHFRLRVQ